MYTWQTDFPYADPTNCGYTMLFTNDNAADYQVVLLYTDGAMDGLKVLSVAAMAALVGCLTIF